MKVVNDSITNCQFGSLKIGDTFAVANRTDVYIVISPLTNIFGNVKNAINLQSGESATFPYKQTVHRVECELHVCDT